MDIQLVSSVIALGALGGIFGLALQFASQVFYVEEDERVVAVEDALPGVNCGACGFPGCSGLANAIVEDGAPVNACPVGGQEVADKISEIMGVDAGSLDKKVARVLCGGDCDMASNKFDFVGVEDCRSRALYYEGNKSCEYGCLGGGTCQKVCEFGAIEMVNGLPVIDKDKCVSCDACINACPKNIIEYVPYDALTVIECFSNDKGKDVRQNCDIGCIGCRICVKSCPEEAIEFKDNLAFIDYDKCTQCGTCVEKCPTKCIKAEYEVGLEQAQ